MSVLAYLVGGWLLLFGGWGIVRSRNLVHSVVCLSVSQAGTYVLLVGIGYQKGATAPVFGAVAPPRHYGPVVDPVVQAMTLTDIVVAATVTALLLALTIQIDKTHGTVDPDRLRELRG
ncbi:MAG TPA: cation:proton antiporter subunit C [Jatrophihabitans sp.]|nr:cation:proton antiporter subunit C [Jatrophihabitans sp.]